MCVCLNLDEVSCAGVEYEYRRLVSSHFAKCVCWKDSICSVMAGFFSKQTFLITVGENGSR